MNHDNTVSNNAGLMDLNVKLPQLLNRQFNKAFTSNFYFVIPVSFNLETELNVFELGR